MKDNKNGQVGIIVAILVISLFVAVIVIIQSYYVPQWMEDKEADHMDVVANQFASLKFSVDLQAMAGSDIPITNSITLGSKELPYFMSSRSFGSLRITPSSGSNFMVSLTPVSGRQEEIYQPGAASSGEIEYVNELIKLDLHIVGFSGGEIFNTSINGGTHVEVRVYGTNPYRISLKTINGTEVLFNQTIASDIPPQEKFIVNLLNSDYKFSTEVLPYVSTPYTLLYNGSSNGNFTIKCTRFGNPSSSITQYPLGILQYESDNAYFVDQTYIYEGGAVILSQDEGEAVISSPSFSATNNTNHIFNITVVDIKEILGKSSVSGYGTYSIRTNYSSCSYHSLIAGGLIINISTDYTSAWKRYFESFLNSSGITNFTVVDNESQNYILITINGPLGGDAYDVKLILTKVEIYAQVGPGWVI
jgi:hypothetical protein